MHDWLAILRPPRTRHPLAVAAIATLATSLLGWTVPATAMAGAVWSQTPLTAALAAILGIGMIAFLLADATVAPSAEPARAALPPTLIAVAMLPHLGIAALAVPALLSLAAARRAPDQRIVALLVHCGAILMMTATAESPVATGFGYVTILVAAWLARRIPALTAVNDNPQMERAGPDSGVPVFAYYAMRRSQPGSGEYGSV